MTSLSVGSRGSQVRGVQTALGFTGRQVDGKFGPQTRQAVERFQRSHNLTADGIVGSRTRAALFRDGFQGPPPATRGAADGTARIEGPRTGRGMVSGQVTVNGHSYRFNSGNRTAFSTPQGEFRVTAHRNSRSDAGFTRDGVGFSFRMEDPRRPGGDRFYDARAGRDRQYLRIHPDGGAAGTAGCLGIVGDAATLRRFRDDMNAELRRNGGTYTLRVQ